MSMTLMACDVAVVRGCCAWNQQGQGLHPPSATAAMSNAVSGQVAPAGNPLGGGSEVVPKVAAQPP